MMMSSGFNWKSGHVHDAVLDAASEQGGEPDGSKGEHPTNYRPAETPAVDLLQMQQGAVCGEESRL
jgi:hypothetical protein